MLVRRVHRLMCSMALRRELLVSEQREAREGRLRSSSLEQRHWELGLRASYRSHRLYGTRRRCRMAQTGTRSVGG